ncbi:MAG: nuclear transport factor 2 family protein [bacterium]|jgi:steroid delta-isomerase|nr:nuclear transport factor 2 family protein [Betaproteobacteria bacterium]
MATDPAASGASAATPADAPAPAAQATAGTRAALARIEALYAGLAPEGTGALRDAYSADAYFRDPFNEVRGAAAIERIFSHMFDQLHAPRFVILERAVDGDTAWLTWDLEYRLKPGQPVRRIHGASQLRFDGDGCVCHHRDYWDAAGELYETLPLLGSVLRLIRGRLRAR